MRGKYGEALLEIDGIGETQLDFHAASKKFFNNTGAAADVSIDSNANVVDKSVINYNFEINKPLMRLNSYYNLWKYLKEAYSEYDANQILETQIAGEIYINDSWDIGRPYCFNFSTYDIALGGLPMGDRVKPVPPKSLYAFVRQVEQFTVYAANSTLGATGLADLLIVITCYVQKMRQQDGTWKDGHYTFKNAREAVAYVHEVLASLIYTLNWQFRGNQSPFTNVSIYDHFFLEELVDDYKLDGVSPGVWLVEMVQEIFLDVMNEELERAPLTFPVVTACFSVDGENNIQDEHFAHLIAEQNAKFGFINMYCGSTSTLSSCCRLRSERTSEYFNSFGAGSSKIGSLGVVTLNLPRLAMNAEGNFQTFLDDIEGNVCIAADINDAKRRFLAKRIEDGVLPLYSLGFMDLKQQYSTCGITGLYEALEILGLDICTVGGKNACLKIIETINKTNAFCERKFKAPHNCEQVPGETSCIKLAEKDRLLGFNDKYELYSNQFIPLTAKADMLDRIELQGAFDAQFTGGAICHVNVAERIEEPAQIVELIKTCAKKGVVYWAINYKLHMCERGHMTVGADGTICPTCGAPIVDTFTRVVGFLTNTKNWHRVRRETDWPNRQFY